MTAPNLASRSLFRPPKSQAFRRDILPRDLSASIPTIRLASNATVPSMWEPQRVERLLAVVDRRAPKGKSDYAILLLAARMGLRLGDTPDGRHGSTAA